MKMSCELKPIQNSSSAFQHSSYFYHPSMMAYSDEYFNQPKNLSFAIFNNGRQIAEVLFTIMPNEQLGYFSAPVGVFVDTNLMNSDRAEIVTIITKELAVIARNEKINKILLRESEANIDLQKFKLIETTEQQTAWCDLSETEEDLLRHMRKSYRSLINWGRRELKLQIIDKANPDLEAFNLFKAFHIQVAGRQTRSDKSWQLQYDAIQAGHSYLIMARLENRLVAGSLVICGDDEAYYGVGVNDRELFHDKKGIGHWPLVAAIFESKKRGYKTFNLGHVGPNFANDKERDIGFFKKGFSDRIKADNTALYEIL